MEQTKIGALIRNLRKEMNFTQQQLAEKLSFIALLTEDTIMLRKQYPEWELKTWTVLSGNLMEACILPVSWYCFGHNRDFSLFLPSC